MSEEELAKTVKLLARRVTMLEREKGLLNELAARVVLLEEALATEPDLDGIDYLRTLDRHELLSEPMVHAILVCWVRLNTHQLTPAEATEIYVSVRSAAVGKQMDNMVKKALDDGKEARNAFHRDEPKRR